MIVTEEWLRSNMNGGIGITAKQLKALGLSWPPQKGWLKNILGKEITDNQAKAFIKGRGNRKSESVPRQKSVEGISMDLLTILSYIKNLPLGEFLHTPLIKFGYTNPNQTICSVCGDKLSNVAEDNWQNGVQYVNVCNRCVNKLSGNKYVKTIAKPALELDSKFTFDDMRKIDE